MWLSFPQLIGFAIVAIAVYVHQREQRRVRQVNESVGKPLLEIRRPIIQSAYGWTSLLAMALLAFETISDGITGSGGLEQLRDVVLGILFLTSMCLILWSFQRGDSLVEAKFGEDGIMVMEGIVVPWQQIGRWTWIDTPHRQLNLFVPGAVHTIRIPSSADQREAENILRRKVAVSEVESHAIISA